MTSKWINATAMIALVICGCRTVPDSFCRPSQPEGSRLTRMPAVEPADRQVVRQNSSQIQQATHVAQVESGSTPDSSFAYYSENAADAIPVAGNDSILAQLEQSAIANSPAIAELVAEIESLKGKLLQAGLPPNPTAGINGEDINEDGGAGRYGIYFGREVVRGNKLELSRSVVCAEIDAAERRLAEVRQRLLTDIRQRYYDVLIAQETVATAAELVSVAEEAAEVSNQLLEAGEVAQTSLLQSRIELQNAG